MKTSILCPKCHERVVIEVQHRKTNIGPQEVAEVSPCCCMLGGPKPWNSHLEYLRVIGADIPAAAFLRAKKNVEG